MRSRWRSKAIASFYAGSPAAEENILNTLPTLAHFAARNSIKARHQTRMLDHESHQFSGVTADIKEFEAILLDECLKSSMCSNSHSMSICIFEYFA